MSPPLFAFSRVAAAILVQLLALDSTDLSRSSTQALRAGGSTGEEKSSFSLTLEKMVLTKYDQGILIMGM